MHEYLYIYFNQKYGLKKLVIENIQTMLNSMVHFRGQHNDITLFQRVLSNQTEEDFKQIQNQIKSTVEKVITFIHRDRFRRKSESQVEADVEAIKQGVIEEHLMVKILDKMYAEEDKVQIMELTYKRHQARVNAKYQEWLQLE